MPARRLHLTRQLSRPAVLARRRLAHPCLHSRCGQRQTLLYQRHQSPHLLVGRHRLLPVGRRSLVDPVVRLEPEKYSCRYPKI